MTRELALFYKLQIGVRAFQIDVRQQGEDLSEIADPRGPWANAIGRAFVAFGSIEYITLRCLEEIPKDRIRRSTSSFKLTQRIELLQELLEAHPGAVYVELSETLEQAKKLAPTRNLVGHNPIFVDFFQRGDGSLYRSQVIRCTKQPQKALTLAQVETFASEAERVNGDLYAAFMAATNAMRGGAVA